MITIDSFKPYGYMAFDFQYEAERGDLPEAWKDRDRDNYERWINATADLIADAVWPRWDPSGSAGQGQWVGNARGASLALTAADLDVMAGVADEQVKTAVRQPGMRTNGWWFREEDDLVNTDWNARAEYLNWSQVTPDEFFEAFRVGATSVFSAGTPWMLKMRLQRPRANQAAYWMGATSPPTVRFAASALSSSAISGHAFQGLFGCLNVHLEFGQKMDAREKGDLLNLAVDIGDRRVIAGIHYPSDNAMSWRVALETIDRLNRTPDQIREMRRFVIGAVNNSRIFQAMRASSAHADCVRFVEVAF